MFDWNWDIQNSDNLDKTIKRCREKQILLPTFSELKNPQSISKSVRQKLKHIDFSLKSVILTFTVLPELQRKISISYSFHFDKFFSW